MSNTHSARSEAIADNHRNEQRRRDGMLLVKIGAVASAALLAVSSQVRHEVMKLLQPEARMGSNPSMADLAKRQNISVAPDTKHPGLERVKFTYKPYQTGTSFVAAEVDPAQDAGLVEQNLSTYPGIHPNPSPGDTITFDVDASGVVVSNPK